MKKKKPPQTKGTKPTARRLQAAQAWIPKYDGQHIVRGYRKHFHVDYLQAIRDLKQLGVIDEERYRFLQKNELARIEAVHRKREEQKMEKWLSMHEDQDDTFFYIAGYTSGGFPYGVTWEEMGLKPWEDPELDTFFGPCEDEEYQDKFSEYPDKDKDENDEKLEDEDDEEYEDEGEGENGEKKRLSEYPDQDKYTSTKSRGGKDNTKPRFRGFKRIMSVTVDDDELPF